MIQGISKRDHMVNEISEDIEGRDRNCRVLTIHQVFLKVLILYYASDLHK